MKEQSVDATEARREFFRLLSEVRFGGRRIVIQRRGRPQAVMIPLQEYHRLKRQDLFRGSPRSETAERNSTEIGNSDPVDTGMALAKAMARELGIEL